MQGLLTPHAEHRRPIKDKRPQIEVILGGKIVVKEMILRSLKFLIQGGLDASFLPFVTPLRHLRNYWPRGSEYRQSEAVTGELC